jgi:hypothetical protein
MTFSHQVINIMNAVGPFFEDTSYANTNLSCIVLLFQLHHFFFNVVLLCDVHCTPVRRSDMILRLLITFSVLQLFVEEF